MSDQDKLAIIELEQKNQAFKIMSFEKSLSESAKAIADFKETTTQKLTKIQMDIDSDKAYEAVNTKEISELRRLLEKIDSQQEIILAEKKLAQEFWRDMKAKLLTAGILSTAGILCTALFFAAKEYVKSLTGG